MTDTEVLSLLGRAVCSGTDCQDCYKLFNINKCPIVFDTVYTQKMIQNLWETFNSHGIFTTEISEEDFVKLFN